jgi:hypothetical protein
LHEGLLDQAVAIAASDGGHELVAHAVGIGAADVVALEQNLVASADAHQLMADFVKAGSGISGAGKGEDGDGQECAVEGAADDGMLGRHHWVHSIADFRLQISDLRLQIEPPAKSEGRRQNAEVKRWILDSSF